jgi:hypothetical protein
MRRQHHEDRQRPQPVQFRQTVRLRAGIGAHGVQKYGGILRITLRSGKDKPVRRQSVIGKEFDFERGDFRVSLPD